MTMNPVLKYSFYEMIRSRWAYIYTSFYLLVTLVLYLMSYDLHKTMISLSNIILGLSPLIGILFGTSYYYNSREFMQILMSQPISRWRLFISIYGGLALTLSLSILIGIGLPLLVLGAGFGTAKTLYYLLLLTGMLLSVIFSLLAFLTAMRFDEKVKGLSVSIFIWLFFGVIYDGIILLLLFLFRDYPLDKFTIGVVLTNPIDLARILLTMQLDVSAMMGYTGAVLMKFIGKAYGYLLISSSLLLWTFIPLYLLKKWGSKKDF